MTRELELTMDELKEIYDFANRLDSGNVQLSGKDTATVLKGLVLSHMRLSADDPPALGPEVDKWYASFPIQNIQAVWAKFKPLHECLKKLGILK